MSGPPPTPTEILQQRGSWRGNVRGNEPKPAVGKPAMPPWVTGRARELWDELVGLLLPLGLVTVTDGLMLAQLCRWAARFEEADQAANEAEVGTSQWRLMLSIADRATGQMLRLSARFGLTPADRGGLSVAVPAAGNGKERFFKVTA